MTRNSGFALHSQWVYSSRIMELFAKQSASIFDATFDTFSKSVKSVKSCKK